MIHGAVNITLSQGLHSNTLILFNNSRFKSRVRPGARRARGG